MPRAELVSVQRMLGRDIALVRLFPLQYGAAAGELCFAPKLKLALTLEPGSGPAVRPLRAHERDRIAHFVDNPVQLDLEPPAPLEAALAPSEACDYLLITRRSLVPAFQPLLDQKVKAGLAARHETVEAIDAREQGRDLPEKVRNFIRYACTNWGVQYGIRSRELEDYPVFSVFQSCLFITIDH